MFNYPGSPDPKVWAMKRDLDAAFAKIKDLAALVNILAKDVTFKLKFDSNEGTGSMSDVTMTGLGSATLPECELTPPTGKMFVAWNTKADGTGVSYADKATVSFRDFKDVTGDVTLYAQWTTAVYAISYWLDGGENAPGNPGFYTYGVGVAGFGGATKEGFEFGGWYGNAEFAGDAVTSVGTSETGDKALYAKFTAEG